MSAWGKLDSKQLTANVYVVKGSATVSNSLGNATTFLTEVNPGDYFAFGLMTYGSNVKYYVSNVISNTTLTLATVYQGATANGKANVQQGPKSVFLANVAPFGPTRNGNLLNIQRIVGVDWNEANIAANKANGISQPGWTYQQVYTMGNGTVRRKSEVLVAMSKNFNRDNSTGTLEIDADDNTAARNT